MMRFRIGTKISLLTCTMVLVTSLFLTQRVVRYCANHVVDHEIVDLVDETNLSAQKMLRSADEMRQDITYLASAIADDDEQLLREALLNKLDPDEPTGKLRDPLNDLLHRHPDFLQAEIIAFKAGQELPDSTVVARCRRRSVKSFDLPAGRSEFLTDLVGSNPQVGQLSKFGQTNVVYSSPEELARLKPDPGIEPEEVPEDGRKLILHGGAVILPAADGKENGPPQPGFVLLVTSHFRLLDSDMSNEDQVAISPRHFFYLVDQNRRFLQHPDPTFVADLAAASTPGHAPVREKTLSDADPVIKEQFQVLHELMALADDSDARRLAKELGRKAREQRIPSLKSWFGFTRDLQPDGQIVSILDPETDDSEIPYNQTLAKRLKDRLDAFLLKHPEYRMSLPSHDIRRFKIRCQSDNQADLLPLEHEIDRQLAQAGITEKLVWESPIRLEDFALHLLRLQYEPNRLDRYLDLAVAVSYQEIASDVDAEMFWIKMGALACSLGAGGLAVLFSLMITRPLNKIITSTNRLAHGEFDLVLPVDDLGEVGVLARSFKEMAGQILERRQAVEQEQAKSQRLNEDLKRERDLLDVRVRERTAELQHTNRDLESARDAALEANRAKSAFLAQMSHELRTPLNAIIGYGELLEEEVADTPASQFVPDLKKIIESGRHLLGLINDILDLSKVEAGKMELNFETFDVKSLIENIVGAVDPLIHKNANRLEWSCAGEVASLHADRTRVRQILLNLLSNSSKFTEQGQIRVTCDVENVRDRPHVVFRVADTGVGMTSEQMQRLFQNFSQVDVSTTRKYGGTGLGLAICRRFCEMMGGDISAASEYQKGSVFTVRLPVAGPVRPVVEQPQASIAPAGAAGTVVVIDDDQSARDLLQRQLGKEGFHVLTAAGGEEGLRLIRQSRPVFITLDVVMPGMDGWDVLSALKADPALCEIPVVILSMVDDSHLGLAMGAADYMTKPIDRSLLLAVSRKYRNDTLSCQSLLVVEDDSDTRALIGRILAGEGWIVAEAENGRAALEKLDECRPALIMLDLLMPEMDGFAFLRELRRSPRWSNTPVVIVTAKDLTQQERSLLNGGVQLILQKGHDNREQLLDQLRALLPRNGELPVRELPVVEPKPLA